MAFRPPDPKSILRLFSELLSRTWQLSSRRKNGAYLTDVFLLVGLTFAAFSGVGTQTAHKNWGRRKR